jgi:predicted transposase YdaD
LSSYSVELGILGLILASEQTAAEQAKQLLKRVQQTQTRESPDAIVELIETTMVYKFPQLSRQEIAAMLELVDVQQTRVYQEGQEDEGKRLILRQLTCKLGPISPTVQSQVEALPLPMLESLGESLLGFLSSDDLVNWLQAHQ